MEPPELTLRVRRPLVYGMAALSVVCLGLGVRNPAFLLVGVVGLLGTAESLRVVIVMRDGTLYERWFLWAEPFLLDSLVSVRVEWNWLSRLPYEQLVMYDRTGQERTLSLDIFGGMTPLLEYVLWRLESEPSIRREPTTVARLEKRVRASR